MVISADLHHYTIVNIKQKEQATGVTASAGTHGKSGRIGIVSRPESPGVHS